MLDFNISLGGIRYYAPYIGRFTHRDFAEQGVNWSIVNTVNNRLKYIDWIDWIEKFFFVL